MSKPHVKARAQHPGYKQHKVSVSDENVAWEVRVDDYMPVEYTHQVVIDNDGTKKAGGWADPPEVPQSELLARQSYCGRIQLDDRQRPRNPHGRTGMVGRGLLGKWGPNHAADPVVTRVNPSTNLLEMVAIQRKDTGEWAIPGGMVDPGECVSATLKREFGEEAMGNPGMSAGDTTVVRRQLDALFSSPGEEIFKGYVDDPRNTDNAWMETVCVHFHCPPELAVSLTLEAADDAASVRWLPVENNEKELGALYASHRDFVDEVVRRFRAKNPRSAQPAFASPSPQEAKPNDREQLLQRPESTWSTVASTFGMLSALCAGLVLIIWVL